MKLAIKHSHLVVMLFFLAACDNRPNLADICEAHDDICNEFTSDTWCRRERALVGIANYQDKTSPSDEHKYQRLIAYENYAACMDHASLIEHIKLKEKKPARIENALKAKEKIKQLATATKHSSHPHLLYFHWSRYLSKEALAKFLQQEGTQALENPESQFNLATYYSKRNPKKTLGLLFRALELYQEGDKVNVEIFKSISSIFAEKKENKLAYIWLKILEIYEPNDKAIKNNTLKNYIEFFQLDEDYLNKVARMTVDNIESGTFKAPRF